MHSFKSFFFLSLLTINLISADSCCKPIKKTNKCVNKNIFGKTFFNYRPQDSNVARRMVGVIDTVNQYANEEVYGTVAVSLQYQQTRNPKKLAKFFSFTGKNPQTYGPSCADLSFVTTSTSNPVFDIYGINFGTTSTGQICMNPKIINTILDFDIYTNWGACICGNPSIWTRVNLPVVDTRYNLHLKDACDLKLGSSTFAASLVDLNGDIEPTVPYDDLSSAFQGNEGFGSVPPLNYGKVHKGRHKTALAGFHVEVGYDFIKNENGFFAAGIHAVAPTGNEPNAKYLFEPVVGANHCWQLGATFSGSYQINQTVGFYFDSIVTHLFKSKQRRLFGLRINGKSSPGSSYLILKEFDATGETVIGLQRAANLLACEAKIKNNIMADLALMVQFNNCCFNSGIGWNFWFRTKDRLECETICKVRCCPFSHNEKYAIKGDAFANTVDTKSKSTIGRCSTVDDTPVFLTDQDIDPSIALNPRAYSNKIFGFIGRSWQESEVWTPFVLLEGEVEFGHTNSAADQWAIMIKGGVSF